jgi:hypothetical protein
LQRDGDFSGWRLAVNGNFEFSSTFSLPALSRRRGLHPVWWRGAETIKHPPTGKRFFEKFANLFEDASFSERERLVRTFFWTPLVTQIHGNARPKDPTDAPQSFGTREDTGAGEITARWVARYSLTRAPVTSATRTKTTSVISFFVSLMAGGRRFFCAAALWNGGPASVIESPGSSFRRAF